MDPKSVTDSDPDPNLLIISDPVGSGIPNTSIELSARRYWQPTCRASGRSCTATLNVRRKAPETWWPSVWASFASSAQKSSSLSSRFEHFILHYKGVYILGLIKIFPSTNTSYKNYTPPPYRDASIVYFLHRLKGIPPLRQG
jgi:hypothetical protein